MKRLLIILWLLVLAGCAQPSWQKVETPTLNAPSGAYSADFPIGWSHFSVGDAVLVSRDGPALQTLKITRRDLDKAFPQTKNLASVDMLSSELADAVIGEIKSEVEAADILENAPAQIDGAKGVRIHFRYANKEGLRFDEVIYAFVDPQGLYTLSYHAPTLYYFERDLAAFEKAVASFKRGKIAPKES